GIFHAALAQLFFVLVSAIALFSSRWWLNAGKLPNSTDGRGLAGLYWLGTGLVFCQLVLGATMRHQHAGLAISDFPLAHHQMWPDTSANAIERYNAERMEITNINPITAFQVILQMVHRMVALAIFLLVTMCAI